MLAGFLILIFGVLMLLDRMGVIYGSVWDYFFPACVIAIGLSLIFKDKTRRP